MSLPWALLIILVIALTGLLNYKRINWANQEVLLETMRERPDYCWSAEEVATKIEGDVKNTRHDLERLVHYGHVKCVDGEADRYRLTDIGLNN